MRDELQRVLNVAREVPASELPRLLGELEEIRCTAMARLMSAEFSQPRAQDELVGIEQAARRLGVSNDYLYRHASDFHFARRMGRKLLFSNAGIEQYIRQQNSLTARQRQMAIRVQERRPSRRFICSVGSLFAQ